MRSLPSNHKALSNEFIKITLLKQLDLWVFWAGTFNLELTVLSSFRNAQTAYLV